MDRRLLDAAFSLEFLARHEHVLLVGPAGVGKSFLAQALGYSAVRAGHTVRFTHADDFFKTMVRARVDNSVDRAFRSFLAPDLLILDDISSTKLGIFKLVIPLLDPEEEKQKAEIRDQERERARQAINEANRRRRLTAKANGICVSCRNTPAMPGISQCLKCRKTNQIRIRERYLRRKAAGLCKRCDNAARNGKTDCEACAKKQREYDRGTS